MWKNTLEPAGPQTKIGRMSIAGWISKATNTLSEYVTVIAFPLQKFLHEHASLLRYTYSACLVTYSVVIYEVGPLKTLIYIFQLTKLISIFKNFPISLERSERSFKILYK